MSWYGAPLGDLRPDIISCRNVAVWNLRSCICGAPSLTRGRVCNLQCNHSIVRVRTRNYTLLSHLRLPQPGGPGSRIHIPQEQGCLVIPLGTEFPSFRLLRLAGLRWSYSNPPSTSRDRFLYIAFRNRMVQSKVKSLPRVSLLMSWGGPNTEPRSDHWKTPSNDGAVLMRVRVAMGCWCIATYTCRLVLLRIGYRCSQRVGGFHGRLPQYLY
jgi:hypothetical protein